MKKQGQQIVRQASFKNQNVLPWGKIPNGFRPANTLEELEDEVKKIKNKTSSLSSNERKATVFNYLRLKSAQQNPKT